MRDMQNKLKVTQFKLLFCKPYTSLSLIPAHLLHHGHITKYECLYVLCNVNQILVCSWCFGCSHRTLRPTGKKLCQPSISRYGTCWPGRSVMLWMQWTERWRAVRPNSGASWRSSQRTLRTWTKLKKISTVCWVSPKHWPSYRWHYCTPTQLHNLFTVNLLHTQCY